MDGSIMLNEAAYKKQISIGKYNGNPSMQTDKLFIYFSYYLQFLCKREKQAKSKREKMILHITTTMKHQKVN